MALLPGIEALAWSHSDALHRALAGADARYWLVLDPSTRSLEAADFPADELNGGIELALPSMHRDLDASLLPTLHGLDSAHATGSRALRASLLYALTELQPRRLTAGGGRAVCAWLRCDDAFAGPTAARRLAAHLSGQLVQLHPAGGARLLRWLDPAVLWAMWPLLNTRQQQALLGPIQALWLLDPAGGLVRLGDGTAHEPSQPLNLSGAQWTSIEHISALNKALAVYGAQDGPCLAVDRARDVAMAALQRAGVAGFTDTDDLAAFAGLALAVHPTFDAHPLVRERLARRTPGDYFTALIDDLPQESWQAVRAEAAK